jgi:hypothetical protein
MYLGFFQRYPHLLIRNHTEDTSSGRTSPLYLIRKNSNHCEPP